jgi:flavodoxin
MKKIKSFIYLDNYKMYSISSQIFEGLTEYMVNSEKGIVIEETEQKGKIGTGKIMADIIESETNHSEKRFLHHYAYNLFEDELLAENKVLTIDATNFETSIPQLENYNFVKITNRLGFNDSRLIEETMERFNNLGVALTQVTHYNELKEAQKLAKDILKSTVDRNQKSKAQGILNKKLNIGELAKEGGLYHDPKFLESLIFLLKFGYHSSFEIQIPFMNEDNYHLFSCLLDRDLLTEKELNIIKKYSRETEKEFTVFGILTQVKAIKEKVSIYKNAIDKINSESTDSTLKEAIMNMIASITNIENSFVGKLDYEYIVDPIAVYREI